MRAAASCSGSGGAGSVVSRLIEMQGVRRLNIPDKLYECLLDSPVATVEELHPR